MNLTEEPTTTTKNSTVPSGKLIDKVVNYRSEHGKPFFSLEFFPPRSETELASFWPLLDQLKLGDPLFMDITWHSRTSLDSSNCLSSLGVAHSTITRFNHETVLHLTCSGYDLTTLELILDSAKSLGIKNILALRGDPPVPKEKEVPDNPTNLVNGDSSNNSKEIKSDQQPTIIDQICPVPTTNNDQCNKPMKETIEKADKQQLICAMDLVQFIRKKFNDYFCLGVAGYPMGHPDAKSYADDLNYLKAKIDAGADFIVTQLSFSADQYISFIKDCRQVGIKVPIIPGIFPIQTQVSIRNIAKLTQIEPPEEVKKAVESCEGDVKAIQQYGLKQVVDLCRQLMNSDLEIPGFHFYTLNRDNCVSEALKILGLWNQRSDRMESTIESQDKVSSL